MKRILLSAALILALASCSDSSSSEPETVPAQNESRLNKIVCVSYNSTGGVENVYTTFYHYDQQNRLTAEVSDNSSLGNDSVIYKYKSGSLPEKIIRRNSYNSIYSVTSIRYDEAGRLYSTRQKQYNQGYMAFSDSAAFIYNGNTRPAQVTHFTHSNTGTVVPYSLQYFYDGNKLIKTIAPGQVRELYYQDQLFQMAVNHSANRQDTVFVEKREQGQIKRISTRNNHNGLLSWQFSYDSSNKITEKTASCDSVTANRYTYQYNSASQLLNYKNYRSENGKEYLTEYQYEYTAGASNKNEINRICKVKSDYADGAITEFLPWQHPIDLP